MRYIITTLIAVLACASVNAHELTPTYPEFKQSIYNNVLSTTMSIFNRRDDISFYQIEVYDIDWNPIEFAARKVILNVEYLERTTFEVYVKSSDVQDVTYICTRSKILKGESVSVVASNICSKVK